MTEHVSQLQAQYGFSHFGWTQLRTPLHFAFYEEWIHRDRHGEMSYLKQQIAIKRNPQEYWPLAKSALVFAFPYAHREPQELPFTQARTSLYAQRTDYHFWLREKLEGIAQNLKEHFPDLIYSTMTDSQPLCERDLAYRAGLGWYGKNTNILNRQHGSLFLLGEILLNIEGPSDQISTDHCGTCTRCLDICPTGAILPNRDLQATKCISYWTIESRQVPPLDIREQIGDWFFGCDLCQTVCPWNEKAFGPLTREQKRHYESEDRKRLIQELEFILTASGKQIQKRVAGTPLLRAGPFGLRRNALVVAGNLELKELIPCIDKWTQDSKIGELARWTLAKFNPDPAS